MASFQNGFNSEGASINRPPLFNGENYSFWKIKMKAFIEGIDVDIWEAIEHGPYIPTHTENEVVVEKPRSQWTSTEKQKAQYGLKAKNIIISALGMDEFCRISNCTTAKEMWEALEVTHEGTNEVKRSRVNTLTREFELFMMTQGESITELQKRFTHIVNQLGALGKTFQNEDLINKVLRCLNRDWQPKVTAITESRDLASMSLATLFGKLQEHELELSRLQQNEDHDNKRKKNIALKTTSPSMESESEEDSDHSEMNDETLTLLARKFGRFLKKKGNQRKPPFYPKRNFRKGESSSQGPTCYECGKIGHMKLECPNYKGKMEKLDKRPLKDKKGRKAYIAWEDNDSESSDESESEEANLCLMADLDEDDLLDEELVSDSQDPSYNELQDAFSELHAKSLIIAKQLAKSRKTNSLLESKIACLTKERDKLTTEKESLKRVKFTCITCINKEQISHIPCKTHLEGKLLHAHDRLARLEKENESLKEINKSCANLIAKQASSSSCISCEVLQKEIDDLKNTLTKFTMGRDNLNLLLGKQGCHFKKAGIGYNPENQQKMYKNFFVPSSSSSSPFIKCYHCGKKGHSASTCNVRKNGVSSVKKVWVSNGTSPTTTNSQGPKRMWVPKTKA